jgi:ParB-like chromosome segregation protein Spo0J
LQREDVIDFSLCVLLLFLKMKEDDPIEEITVFGIGERYGVFRIVNPRADAAMMQSIQRYGQMSPVVCVKTGSSYERIDGFKRLRACRRLHKPALWAKTMQVSARACKAALIQLNRAGRSIHEMEEALVLQSLHREDGLTQIEIAALLGRHKSWVSRRISLIERVREEIQEDIRLGLISVVTGRELAKLPRGNQKETAGAIVKHRLSTREAAKLISHLLSRPRWEYSAILAAPWELIEPRRPKPVGIEADLISMHQICQSVSEGLHTCSVEKRRGLSELIHWVLVFAEGAVQSLRAER